MKTKRMSLVIALLSCFALQLMAQTAKVSDSDLVGTWVMESMQWEGEKKIECGIKYTQVKVYRADGEYACAEVAKQNDGTFVVLPHEYGTYTYKNGIYTEMGREPSVLQLVDKTTFKGQWKKRHDVWKKRTNMPERLTQYIVDCCKTKQAPAEIQQMIRKHMFKPDAK